MAMPKIARTIELQLTTEYWQTILLAIKLNTENSAPFLKSPFDSI